MQGFVQQRLVAANSVHIGRIDEINSNSPWKVMKLIEHNNWWEDNPVNSIFQAKNGDWYSSLDGSINFGGTCFSQDGKSWEVLDFGLGTDTMSRRSEQFFTETPNGRVFMIQYLDERIYKTDTSIITGMPKPIENNSNMHIYPNPIGQGENFTLKLGNNYNHLAEISIYDIRGKQIYYARTYNDQTNIPAPANGGIYIVCVRKNYMQEVLKIVVR
jgi:hypothetical protein